MVETFATSQYKEKFLGNLTFTQSALIAAAAMPAVFLATQGYPQQYLIGYAALFILFYALVAYFGLDELAASVIKYETSVRRILWHNRRMKKFIGVEDIRDDTVYTCDGRLLSVIKVYPKDLGGLGETEVERVLAGYGTFLHELSTNIQIIMSSTEVDVEGYLRTLREKVLVSENKNRLSYFEHFSEFLRRVVNSKTVTDREYHIVITQPASEDIKKSTNDLDAKTKNLITSLKDAAIECSRLGTDSLVRFYANFYNPRFAPTCACPTTITFHENEQGLKQATEWLKNWDGKMDPFFPISPETRKTFEKGGLDTAPESPGKRTNVVDQLMPTSVDIQKDCAEIYKLHRVLYTLRFPAIVHPGWLTKLIRQAIDFDLVFHIHPLSAKTSIDYLQNEITKLETDVTVKQREGLLVAERDKVNLQKVRELLNRVSRDEEKCFDVALYVNVKAYTKKDLDLAVMRIRDVMEGMNVQVRCANWEMEDALKSCYPLAQDLLGERRDRMFPSSAVRDSYPFILSSLEDAGAGAAVVGYNQLNGIPVLLDLFRQPNPHVLVLGSSGSGKSFLVKKLFLCMALQDIDIFIVDPQGEYSKVVREMGGNVIKLGQDSSSSLNLFDLALDTYDNRKSSIKAFFNILLGQKNDAFDAASSGIIDKTIDNAYRKKGIYPDEPKTYFRQPPTFTDLYEALNQFTKDVGQTTQQWRQTTAETLLTNMTPLVSGDMRYLNQQTSVDLSGKNIICFDTSSTTAYKKEQRALALFIVFDFIYTWVRRQSSTRKKMIIVDEAWSVFENNQDYLGPIARCGRKDNISLVMIDQNVEDLLSKDESGNTKGHAILGNTSTKFILRQEAAAMKLVGEKFALTKGQSMFVQNAGVGDVLMLTPAVKLPIYVLASEREKNMLSTTPHELEALKKSAPSAHLNLCFDASRDCVLPTEILEENQIRRLECEGYKEIVDTGITLCERTVYYVKAPDCEDAIHFLRKTLIMKYMQRLTGRGAENGHPTRVFQGEGFEPDVTVAPENSTPTAIEILTREDITTPTQITRKKLAELRRSNRWKTVFFVAPNDEVKAMAEELGYANVIACHQLPEKMKQHLTGGNYTPA